MYGLLTAYYWPAMVKIRGVLRYMDKYVLLCF